MKTVKIYLTRHGQTYYNLEERMQGQIESGLTNQGIEQAEALSERLKNSRIDHIYSSPLRRASHTAEIINVHHKKTIKHDPRLKEMGFGSWEGLAISDIKEDYEDEAHAFWKAPETYTPIDGESFKLVQSRLKSFFHDIVKDHSGGSVLLVCHAMLIRNIFSYLMNQDVSTVWNHPRIYQTSLTVLEYDGTQATFEIIADASHYNFD